MKKQNQIYWIIGIIVLLILAKPTIFGRSSAVPFQEGSLDWKGYTWIYSGSGWEDCNNNPYPEGLLSKAKVEVLDNKLEALAQNTYYPYGTCGFRHTGWERGSINVKSNLNLCDYKSVKFDGVLTVTVSQSGESTNADGSITGKSIKVRPAYYESKTLKSHNWEYKLQDNNRVFFKDLEGNSELLTCPQYFEFSITTGEPDNGCSATSSIEINDIKIEQLTETVVTPPVEPDDGTVEILPIVEPITPIIEPIIEPIQDVIKQTTGVNVNQLTIILLIGIIIILVMIYVKKKK